MTDLYSTNNTEVFVYTEGAAVPRDVVHVRVHPTVSEIPAEAFRGCIKLEEVELCEGLLDIKEDTFLGCRSLVNISIPNSITRICQSAFANCMQLEEVKLHEGLQQIGKMAFFCCKSLKHINIPSTVTMIHNQAFDYSSLVTLNLHDNIESIGNSAFYRCKFTHFRLPSSLSTLKNAVFSECESLVSLELPESITRIEPFAFYFCYSLRNIAISSDTLIESEDAFMFCTDLRKIFGYSATNIINALQHRFDNLPIHKMIYYQSYNNLITDQLNNATNRRCGQRRSLRSKVNPSGKQQDCLGMTPLHIMACSTVQNLELYRVLITKYPESLIIEDRWGAVPLLYAVWGRTPSEILQFLVESYKSLYPNHVFNWTSMIKTLGVAGAQKICIVKLHNIQQTFFPDQSINWTTVIQDALISPPDQYYLVPSSESFRNLIQCSISDREEKIGLKQWRDDISDCIKKTLPTERNKKSIDFHSRRTFYTELEAKLSWYEVEYHMLKDATSILELALWKFKIDNHRSQERTRRNKKMRSDQAGVRDQCRISSGVDIIIQHTLPFLIQKH